MKHSYFITGIGTEVGKTLVASIITEALEADYWKPIQAGDLNNSDSHKVERLISNSSTHIHQNAFALNTPMSPHAAAEIDGQHIESTKINRPKTDRDLVIEGAGGLLVPISDSQTIADLIQPQDRVIVVSRHYLGSINHSLLTLEALKSRGIDCFGIVFSGNKTESSEEIILKMSGVRCLGRIDNEPYFDKTVVKQYAQELKGEL